MTQQPSITLLSPVPAARMATAGSSSVVLLLMNASLTPRLRIAPPLPTRPKRPAYSYAAGSAFVPMVRPAIVWLSPLKMPLKLPLSPPIGVQLSPVRSRSASSVTYWLA